MADISSRVVRRSCALFREAHHATHRANHPASHDHASHPGRGSVPPYASDFGYREVAYAKDEGVARNLASPMAPIERRVRMIERGKLPSPADWPSALTLP